MLVPLIVATALFMENMDSTVLATSLPVIATDLKVDPIALKLALTSYLVSLAVFIPVSGWMADRFGARTIFRAAIAVFMAGSLLSALASSLAWFVFARFVQGMGGAMMVPVGRLVILRSVPKSEMVQALAWLTIPAMIGPVVGPPLGGFITTYFDWRWIFFINIPIGLLGILLASVFIENVREEDVPPLDLKGFALTTVGLSTLMLGFATSGRHLVSTEVSLACVVTGAVTLILYWQHARRAPNPVIDLNLLHIPTFRAGVLGGSLFRVGVGAVPFLLPLMLQIGFGLNALQSGLLTFAAAAGAMFMKTLAGAILRRFGFRNVLMFNAVVASAFIAASGLFTPATPHGVIITVLLAGGFFRSLQFTSINAVAYADVSNREMSLATSFSSVAQQLSLSVGVAAGAFALEATGWLRGTNGLQPQDFWPAFVAVALVSATSLAYWMRLDPAAGAEVSGHVARRVESARKITAQAIQEHARGK
ncbi:DHA2 family efflux MFS transporter permease subunit [Chelatococcus sp. SYSU_G07232]|uniref:DHA2 family efflux MFS transporter permease subunit n=2 Tax=Chelatococcus albus TaxID=3047466 RepID=A0ABT7ALC8_9HYPH|nr:DHA2 family efflux MFS transporter permease subunit [Chelatococcus sp. SYSU_G07232]MDJ1160186.1 DHA2 family efflux MFS transporter permease subunit [Chelatococcus sp. SYSU_G07232]